MLSFEQTQHHFIQNGDVLHLRCLYSKYLVWAQAEMLDWEIGLLTGCILAVLLLLGLAYHCSQSIEPSNESAPKHVDTANASDSHLDNETYRAESWDDDAAAIFR